MDMQKEIGKSEQEREQIKKEMEDYLSNQVIMEANIGGKIFKE